MPVTTRNDRGVSPLSVPKTVLIGETQRIYSYALEQIIASLHGFKLIGSFRSFEELINKTVETKPDLVLLDDHLLESAPDRVKWVLSAHPDARIIVEVDTEEVGFCLGAFLQGAMAVVPRHVAPEILADCLHHVAEGTHWTDHQVEEWIILDCKRRSAKTSNASNSTVRPLFSPRETQVASLMIKLQHNKEIAAEIGITEQSVKNTLSRMFRKAGVSTREELRTHCIERGLLASPQHTHHSAPHTPHRRPYRQREPDTTLRLLTDLARDRKVAAPTDPPQKRYASFP